MNKTFSVLAAVAIVAGSASSVSAFTLVGSELRLRLEIQRTSTSELLVNRFPASAIVSESAVEFPTARSLFPSNELPGFSTVNAAIDAGADFLELSYANAGTGRFAGTFRNDYVFTFTAPVALQITNVLIDPLTNLGLTPDRITFSGNELAVNVNDLSFNRNSFVRLNLTTVAVSEPLPDPIPEVHPDADAAAVPEPSTMLMLVGAAAIGTFFKRRGLKQSPDQK